MLISENISANEELPERASLKVLQMKVGTKLGYKDEKLIMFFLRKKSRLILQTKVHIETLADSRMEQPHF